MTPYSLTAHLSMSLFGTKTWEGFFAVFSAYFDASGKETDGYSKYMSVSGFVIHADTWIQWEKKWLECLERRKIFNKEGLPEFHMSDCANYRYFFQDWKGKPDKEQERQDLLHELMDIIAESLSHKVSCVVGIEDYKKYIDPELREAFGISGAYVMLGRGCAARVKEWCKHSKSPVFSKVEFFFEKGDGDEIQRDLLLRLQDDEFPTPLFKRKKNKYTKLGELVEHGLIPFQAADILAYLTYCNARYGENTWEGKENIHWMFNDISKIPESVRFFDEDAIRSFNTILRVCQRLGL
jgi:hypothetical protein